MFVSTRTWWLQPASTCSHLDVLLPKVYYTLATISPATAEKQAAPHARYVVHRGFVNEQRSKESPSGVEPYNADFGSNTVMLTTTDVRAPKARQIVESAKEGGANGEICWWNESSQMQVSLGGK